MLLAIFANLSNITGKESVPKGGLIWLYVIPAAVGLMAISLGVVSYIVKRFGIVDGVLVVSRKGWWRQERTIPLERIQNVQITQSLLERIMNIATVQVETASGTGVEASLKSVSVADANLIKNELMGTHAPVHGVEADRPPLVYKAELKDILLAGALQNRSLVIIAAIFGLFGDAIDNVMKMAVERTKSSHIFDQASHNLTMSIIYGAIAVLLFLFIGWVISIGYTVFVYYGFKVLRTEKGLEISYGLVNTVKTVLPVKRVQAINTNASWLFRLLGVNQLYVQSLGGYRSKDDNGGNRKAGGQTLVAPICRPSVLRELITLINPNIHYDNLEYSQATSFLFWRSLMRLSIFFVLVFGGFWIAGINNPHFPILVSCSVALCLYVLFAGFCYLAYRRFGFAKTDEVVVVRTGLLGVNLTMIPIGNIQTVEFTTSPMMRRLGLIALKIATPASATNIECIPKLVGNLLRDEIIEASYGHKRQGL